MPMHDKRKLIIFTTSHYPFVGGVETAIQEISRRLQDKFDICIVTARFSRRLPKCEIRPEGKVVRVGIGWGFDKWLLLFLGCIVAWRSIGARNKAILWGVDISQGSIAAMLCKMLLHRCPFILNIQYGYGDSRLASGRFGMIGFALRQMLRLADRVTVISSYLGDVARAYGYRGVIDTIHNGVAIEEFAPETHLRKTTAPVIVTISRLVEKNGIDTLIRAIAVVKKIIPDLVSKETKSGMKWQPLQCHIIGDGPDRLALERLAKDLGVEHEVKFFGSVPFEKIPVYLHNATIFVRLSRSEGMGVSFVEALAAGLPIIGTPVGGIADIIIDGVTGLFAKVDDPDDAAEKIMRLLQDSRLSQSIVENGKKMLQERFLWNSIAKKYADIFERSLSVRKRILITTGLFPPEIGGPATYSKLLQDALPAFGLVVTVLPFRTVRRLPKLIRHVAYFWKVFWKGMCSDIIFSQDPVSVGVPAAVAALLLHKKFVLKIVGDYAWEQGSQRFGVSDRLDEFLKKKYGWKVEMLRRLQKWSASRAKRIVVPSEYLRGVVIQWGIAPERIEVIYNAFDPPGRTLSRDEARKKLGYTGTVLVSVGRLVPWKGFDALIELSKVLQQDIPDIRIMIIGSGPEYQDLAQKISDSSRSADTVISLVGSLSHEDMLATFVAGDVFILNTGYEGFSHTLLEAMAMGIPICTTRAGGNEELIRDGETGMFFEYNNVGEMRVAVERIVADKNLRDALVKRAKEKVLSFSPERMLGEIATLLKNV